MPGYVLDGAGRVELSRQPLAITVTALDVPVTVRAITADGADAPSVLYPKPGFVVLPRVDAEVVVVATPGHDLGFPQGTVLQATVAVDSSHSLDPDRAELTPLDVSGLHHVELATITPVGQRLAVAARKTAVDVPLTDLGARARSLRAGRSASTGCPNAARYGSRWTSTPRCRCFHSSRTAASVTSSTCSPVSPRSSDVEKNCMSTSSAAT